MTQPRRTNSVQSERAVLVGVLLDTPLDPEHPLNELGGLTETAGAQVVAELTQRRERPDQTTYLGSGKVAELAMLVEHHDADVVIFDNDLSPAQTRNLERELKTKVLDRSEVILDIFAAPRPHLRGTARRGTRPTRILPATTQADVDPPCRG